MLGKKTVYIGSSKKTLEMVKEALEKNNIRYKQNVINHNTAFLGPGCGYGRTVSGMDSHENIYEILVKRKEYRRAKIYIQKYKEKLGMER